MSGLSARGRLAAAGRPATPLQVAGVRPKRGLPRAVVVRRALLVADLLALAFAFALAMLIFGSHATSTNAIGPLGELGLFCATLPGWLFLAKLYGLYDLDERHAGHSTVDEAIPVVTLVTIGSWLLYGGAALSGFATPYPPKLLTFWLLAIGLVLTFRVLARAACRRTAGYLQDMIVVGAGETGMLLARKLEDHPEFGVRVLGFVDVDGRADAGDPGRLLGSLADLPDIVRDHHVERVLIAFPNAPRASTASLVRELHDQQVQVDIVPRFVDFVSPGATIHDIEGLPLISLSPLRPDRISLALKRALDLVGSVVGLLLLAPVFAWIALRVKLDSPGPVFYRQARLGRGGAPFSLVKFRTMYVESSRGDRYGGNAASDLLRELLADPERRAEFERSEKLAEDPRVTRFGRALRRLSLDELPQLINVLVGDMSLVGPRPVEAIELPRYGDEAETLLTFKPGLTGYWQINGRSRTEYEDRVRLQLAYVRGWSLKLDLVILGKTAWALVTGHGAY